MTQPNPPTPPRRGLARFAAAALVLVGLVGSVAAASAWRSSVAERAEQSMEVTVSAASAAVTSNVARSVDVLEQLRALVVATPDITNSEFARYWQEAEIGERFPGVLGLVRVDRVSASDVDEFLEAAAADPVTGLDPPDELAVFPPGSREEYCLQRVGLFGIRQVEDFEIPAGLDFCAVDLGPGLVSEIPSALEASTASGELVTFRFDPLEELFIVVLPLYEDGEMPSTEAQRRAASKGWVVSTLDPDALTAGAELQSGLAIEVRHRDELGDEVIVPRAGPAPTGDDLVTSVDTQDGWTIEVVGDPSPAGLSPGEQGLVVLAVGVLLTMGGAAYIWLLSGARDRALELVAERTAELAHQALHDELTGLPNRALIRDRAQQLLGRAERDGASVAAMFLDLDDFKSINDTLGHGVGDELLVAVARRFEGALRGIDTVGRLGGDEFVILVESHPPEAGPQAVAQRLLDLFAEPFELAGESHRISASVGVAIGSRSDVDEWLRDADIALYEAKARGKARYAVFHPAMRPPAGATGDELS